MYLFQQPEINTIAQYAFTNIDPEMRGYSISPSFDSFPGMSASQITNMYCPTGRKLFLEKSLVDFGKNIHLVKGGAIHSLIERIFRSFSRNEWNNDEFIDYLKSLKSEEVLHEILWEGERLDDLHAISGSEEKYSQDLNMLFSELRRIIDLEINRFRNIDNGGVISIVDIEKYVSVYLFYLNKGKIDTLLTFDEKIGVCDLKTGNPYKENTQHKYQVALYAMLFERDYHIDINWGVLVFPYKKIMRRKTLLDKPYQQIFPIGDSLRNDLLSHLGFAHGVLSAKQIPEMCSSTKVCFSREICLKGIDYAKH